MDRKHELKNLRFDMMKIKDTTEEMREKQIEIIHSKSASERAKMGIDMIDTIYHLTQNVIQSKNPGMSEGELIAEIFCRYYKNDFTYEQKEKIKEKIIAAHNTADNSAGTNQTQVLQSKSVEGA